jgi:hypothetical protein
MFSLFKESRNNLNKYQTLGGANASKQQMNSLQNLLRSSIRYRNRMVMLTNKLETRYKVVSSLKSSAFSQQTPDCRHLAWPYLVRRSMRA